MLLQCKHVASTDKQLTPWEIAFAWVNGQIQVTHHRLHVKLRICVKLDLTPQEILPGSAGPLVVSDQA